MGSHDACQWEIDGELYISQRLLLTRPESSNNY